MLVPPRGVQTNIMNVLISGKNSLIRRNKRFFFVFVSKQSIFVPSNGAKRSNSKEMMSWQLHTTTTTTTPWGV